MFALFQALTRCPTTHHGHLPFLRLVLLSESPPRACIYGIIDSSCDSGPGDQTVADMWYDFIKRPSTSERATTNQPIHSPSHRDIGRFHTVWAILMTSHVTATAAAAAIARMNMSTTTTTGLRAIPRTAIILCLTGGNRNEFVYWPMVMCVRMRWSCIIKNMDICSCTNRLQHAQFN